MNPSYSNSSPSSFPFIDLNEDHHLEHLISLPHHPTPSISTPIYFNLNQEYQICGRHSRESLQNQKKVEKNNIVLFGGSSDRGAISSSSSLLEATAGDMVCKREDHEDEGKSSSITDHDGSMKWMSSKMRVMPKMMNSNSDKPACRSVVHKFNDQIKYSTNYNSNDFVRVCSDCNTTKTPLWRGGPQGPKSLCNACGIRQRKARRAMAEAANGTELINTGTKKSRTSYIAQNKQHFKLIGTNSAHTSDQKKLSFEDFALSLTSKKNLTIPDEEEAAILLMALSCGLIHS